MWKQRLMWQQRLKWTQRFNQRFRRGCLAAFATLTLFSLQAQAQTQVRDARLWPAPDHVRLVLDLGGSVKYSVFALQNPDRLVIDLADTRMGTNLARLDLRNSPVQGVRTAVHNGKDLRIVLDLNRPLEPKLFNLTPNEQYGHRLVIDMIDAKVRAAEGADEPVVARSAAQPATVVRPAADGSDNLKRDIVVVIDAGHGGDDPGAIGPSGVREKDVVLAMARELQSLLSNERGFAVRLTRKGDYFIPLRQRTVLARKNNADLFVSIHADAFTNPAAKGASVFALSGKSATSETARWLAQNENRSDLIGGVGGVSLDDKDNDLAKVLLDLSMTKSMEHSIDVGNVILGRLGKVSHLHKPKVEQAGFMVLKSPDIPSVLVETGFISHPGEEAKLSSKAYQRTMAESLRKGIVDYFNKMPPHGTLLAWEKRQKNGGSAAVVARAVARAPEVVFPPQVRSEPRSASAPTSSAPGRTVIASPGHQAYRIQRGDTLSGIARRNQTSVSRLMEFNRLASEGVQVGQVIRIPMS